MVKCTNCGHECESGLFCPECGQKLERRCFSCGEVVAMNARFCPSCGSNLSGEAKSTPAGGEGNVIAGDVSGSYNTTFHTSVVNNYTQVIKEEDANCTICGKTIPASSKDLFRCKVCGKFYCADHMDVYAHKCFDCQTREKNAKFDRCKAELKMRMYDSALAGLRSAMNDPDSDPDVFFYAAIALMGGKKAFIQKKAVIDEVLACINKALQYEKKGIYYYFLAYIKYDYFERKYLRTSPNYKEAFAMARQAGLTLSQVQELYALLGVERPSCL